MNSNFNFYLHDGMKGGDAKPPTPPQPRPTQPRPSVTAHSPATVSKARALHASGATYRAIADQLGVAFDTVASWVTGRRRGPPARIVVQRIPEGARRGTPRYTISTAPRADAACSAVDARPTPRTTLNRPAEA